MLNLQLSHYFLPNFLHITEYIPHIRRGSSPIDVIKIDRSEWGVSGRDGDDDDRVIRAHIGISHVSIIGTRIITLSKKRDPSLEKTERDRAACFQIVFNGSVVLLSRFRLMTHTFRGVRFVTVNSLASRYCISSRSWETENACKLSSRRCTFQKYIEWTCRVRAFTETWLIISDSLSRTRVRGTICVTLGVTSNEQKKTFPPQIRRIVEEHNIGKLASSICKINWKWLFSLQFIRCEETLRSYEYSIYICWKCTDIQKFYFNYITN